MKDGTGQDEAPKPQPVPERATRCGSSRAYQWGSLVLSQDSALIWTDRMLAALARGNDERKWHTLIDKVYSPRTLEVAMQAVVENGGAPGIDGMTTKAMAQNAVAELAQMERLLRETRYQPKAVKRVWLDKPGSRDKRAAGYAHSA